MLSLVEGASEGGFVEDRGFCFGNREINAAHTVLISRPSAWSFWKAS
jgi:hypothetical protein